jgi:tricorn protease
MRIFLPLFLLVSFSFTASAQKGEAYFLSQPCLTPDGQTVIFSFEGDLWKADLKDGLATRLTAMQGYETNARVSPDGKWVAFTGRQYGNADVYLMSLSGGDIRQITFHSAGDEVSSWSWDSKSIYFNSSRTGPASGYKVSMAGGTPQRVFGDYYYQYDHNLVEAPSTGEIFFNDTWESNNQAQRKRYKGAFNPDIQSYNFKTGVHKKYTNWEGKDFSPSIDSKGNIYFISDESNGEYNLYSFEKEKKTRLTNFPSSIKNPYVNANGGKVVFEKDYQLWWYDVAARRAEKMNITIIRNNVLSKEKDFDVRGRISAFDASPDGKKIAFVSRGEIFVSDPEGKFIRQVNRGAAERASEVKWLSDNKTLLFTQTARGYQNIYTVAAGGAEMPKQITNEEKDHRSIVFNKAKTMAAYICGRDELRLLNLTTLQSSLLVKDEFWGFDAAAPAFSPGEEYISFAAYRNFETDIFLYNMKTKQTINLTNTGITESSPLWSGDGKYIYFTSSRLKPNYPFGADFTRVYRLPLEKVDQPFRSDKFEELFKEEKKDTSKKAAPAPVANTVVIDADNIMERMEAIGPSFGSQNLVAVYQKAGKTTVLYSSDHAEGRSALWKTVIEPFEANKTEKIGGTDASFGYETIEAGDKYYLLAGGTLSKLNIEGSRAEPVNIGFTFRRNLQEEFSQIFEEAWAKLEINYYDENFHGVNWAKVKEKYRPFLEQLNTRSDLRVLLNDMLGELNSSHQGFNTGGDDETITLQNRTMETGIIFDNAEPFKVKYTVKRSNADRKGIDIRAGDVLVKVNGETVDNNIDRNYYFTKPSIDGEIKLSFSRAGQIVEVKIHPQTNLAGNLQDEWIDKNQQRVDEQSKNRIAYSCMKNMGTGELEKFIIDMTQELNSKDALILDLRYNTGGNVHDEVLKFLQQKSYLRWKYREGKLTNQGNFTPSDKPIVLLINEQSLSDAEMTAQGFRALKLGKIIGNETYRWIIFTSGASLVDGSFVRLPSWGCYTLDGKDMEMAGVAPDILVINTFSDKLNGRDPQLDKAIEVIMKQLNK